MSQTQTIEAFARQTPSPSEASSFMAEAEERLTKLGYISCAGATKEVRESAKGIISVYPYFVDFFSEGVEDPVTEETRLRSLFVGAAAYGEHDIAAGALSSIVKIAEDMRGSVKAVSAEVGRARQYERVNQIMAKAGLGIMTLNGDEFLKRDLKDQAHASLRRQGNLQRAMTIIERQIQL